jgi:high-affinity Fe2+/Pb2+ permease
VLIVTLIIVRLSVFSLRLALAVLAFILVIAVVMVVSAVVRWFRRSLRIPRR